MPQLFPGQGVLEGVMAGRQAEANLADTQAQSRLRQIQAIAANAELQKEQKKMQTLQGLYSGELKTPGVENFSAEPMDRQMEILSRHLMPFDPDTGLKAYDKATAAKKERLAQEARIEQQKVLSNIFAGQNPDDIATSEGLTPQISSKLAAYYGGLGDVEEAKKWGDLTNSMLQTKVAMAEAEPKLRKLESDIRHRDLQSDALEAKAQQGTVIEPEKKAALENSLRGDAQKATEPLRVILGNLQSVRTLLGQDSAASHDQIRQGLVGLLSDIRQTKGIYEDSKDYGDIVGRTVNMVKRKLIGEPTLEYKQEVAKMIDDAQNRLIMPKLRYYEEQYEGIAKRQKLDPENVIVRERGEFGQPEKPAPTKGAPKGPTKITSKADLDKLPSGAEFIAPDGKVWRKK